MSLSPILKWVGGKSQILNEVMDLFPVTMNNYYEPFLGGGSILFALLSYKKMGIRTITGTVYANDLNGQLIEFFKTLKTQPQELIQEAEKLIQAWRAIKGTTVERKPTTQLEATTSRESYYFWVRSQYNALPAEQKSGPKAAAMFLFLNKTCFRGLYREGPNGFNVPYGNYENPAIINKAHFLEVSELLQNVVFSCVDYKEFLANVQQGDFIYLDPPYAQIKETSFVGYTATGFDGDEQKRLFELCHQMKQKGARFLLSNANVDAVKNAFTTTGYQIKTLNTRRAITPKNPKARSQELLILTV